MSRPRLSSFWTSAAASGLFRGTVTFSLIAFYACSDKVRRGAFAALSARQYVIERQVFCVFVFTAVLTTVSIANVNPGTFHCGLAAISANVDVVAQPNHRRHGKRRRGRMKDIVAIVFLDKDRTAKHRQTERAHQRCRAARKKNSKAKLVL